MPARKNKAGRKSMMQSGGDGVPPEFREDVDQFHDRREREVLVDDADQVSDLSGDNGDVGVYDLDLSEEDSDGADDRLAQLERQERALRSRLQVQQGEDSDSEDEPESTKGAGWGSKKKFYYENNQDASDGESGLEEEEEGKKLQQAAVEALDEADFGAGDSDEESEGAQQEEGFQNEGIQEEIATLRSGDASTADNEDAQELLAVLSSLQSSLKDVRSRIAPLISQVREGGLATAEGVSYLEAKNLLLLHYCLNLVYYLLLRAEGRPVQQHPVVLRLVELRTFMEKIRPLDKKLHHQIDRLLSSHKFDQVASQDATELDADQLQYLPKPGSLIPRVGLENGDQHDADHVYRPPKLHPVSMMDDPDKVSNKDRHVAAKKARQSMRSDIVRELAREVHGMPEEVKAGHPGDDNAVVAKQRERLEKRAAAEEDLMMRVPLAKKELKSMKAARRLQATGGALLDDFGDEVADLVQASDGANAGFGNVSQKFGVDLRQETRGNARSGDAELPGKSTLAERRAKMDNARARNAFALESLFDSKASKRAARDYDDMEDTTYLEAKKHADTKKKARKEKYEAPAPLPPLEDEEMEGAHRKVSRAVDKNRGLTPHRRKDTKNPRVRGRKKFEKAKIRRKGQVTDVKHPTGRYSGEETGIKSKVSRSVKF